jgi:dinuclear metal center YbgI/SA1388 family protein
MKTDAVLDLLDALFTPGDQESWDNSGRQLVFGDDPVTGIMIALDCTVDLVREAAEKGCSLIVTHHPVFFRDVRRLETGSASGAALLAARSGISVVSYHTCADRRYLAELAQAATGLPVEIVPDGASPLCGVVDAGAMPIGDFCAMLERRLDAPVRCAGSADRTTGRAAFINGSGGSLLEKIVKTARVSCVVTGDAGHHHAIAAREAGVVLIDAGHFATEQAIRAFMRRDIIHCLTASGLGDLKVYLTSVESDPFGR